MLLREHLQNLGVKSIRVRKKAPNKKRPQRGGQSGGHTESQPEPELEDAPQDILQMELSLREADDIVQALRENPEGDYAQNALESVRGMIDENATVESAIEFFNVEFRENIMRDLQNVQRPRLVADVQEGNGGSDPDTDDENYDEDEELISARTRIEMGITRALNPPPGRSTPERRGAVISPVQGEARQIIAREPMRVAELQQPTSMAVGRSERFPRDVADTITVARLNDEIRQVEGNREQLIDKVREIDRRFTKITGANLSGVHGTERDLAHQFMERVIRRHNITKEELTPQIEQRSIRDTIPESPVYHDRNEDGVADKNQKPRVRRLSETSEKVQKIREDEQRRLEEEKPEEQRFAEIKARMEEEEKVAGIMVQMSEEKTEEEKVAEIMARMAVDDKQKKMGGQGGLGPCCSKQNQVHPGDTRDINQDHQIQRDEIVDDSDSDVIREEAEHNRATMEEFVRATQIRDFENTMEWNALFKDMKEYEKQLLEKKKKESFPYSDVKKTMTKKELSKRLPDKDVVDEVLKMAGYEPTLAEKREKFDMRLRKALPDQNVIELVKKMADIPELRGYGPKRFKRLKEKFESSKERSERLRNEDFVKDDSLDELTDLLSQIQINQDHDRNRREQEQRENQELKRKYEETLEKLKKIQEGKGDKEQEGSGGQKQDSVNVKIIEVLDKISDKMNQPAQMPMIQGGQGHPPKRKQYGGGPKLKGLTKDQKDRLREHSKTHSSKHTNSMKMRMMRGKSWDQAHKEATEKFGK